ncbi:MAG: endonuclease/exonuclease/phosphatase family protein, partial [Duodenibacillus sp.]
VDTWTLGLHAPETYSWWDYRQAGFEKNHGLRIDHLLATPKTAASIAEVWIDTAPRALEKPSDHAPVVLTLDA